MTAADFDHEEADSGGPRFICATCEQEHFEDGLGRRFCLVLRDERGEWAEERFFCDEICFSKWAGLAIQHLPPLLVPDYDSEAPQAYPGDIKPGSYSTNQLVALLRQHAPNTEAILFIADMLEK